MYVKYFKRLFDFILSLIALLVLSFLIIILTIVGIVAMHGNPFFIQARSGKKGKDGKEKIFYLIKFRTMLNKKDKYGKFLPDNIRLNKYGKILRSTSLDELPQLFNIFIGNMAIVGPRPLLVEYLPYYTEQEHHRHDIRPGLTGLAQINGRNSIKSWEERFNYDLQYVTQCSFIIDIKILLKTIYKVIKKSDIIVGSEKKVGRLDDSRRKQPSQSIY